MEQPLPPYGACLLGSFNLTKYIYWDHGIEDWEFNYELLKRDIPYVVRSMDNVIDRTVYPLKEQRTEAQNKRRMGLGVTGVANAGEALGFTYGSPEFLMWLEAVMRVIRDSCYKSSISLALEKGVFPMFSAEKYLDSGFAQTLPEDIRRDIFNYGIRNSHLLSVAPTGTISLSADNVSSGIEPVFSHFYDRTIQTFEGQKVERVEDYGYRVFGVKGKTADQLSVFDHVKVLNLASKYVDSACSKTCNVGDEVTWDQFKQVYMDAYLGGASGCTTFRASGKRYGILNAAAVEDVAEEPEKVEDKDYVDESVGTACYYDPTTGLRTCE
jgi:ribonucleoside-diphosphate reductase alpha chain